MTNEQLNQCIFAGRVTRDPEMKILSTGTPTLDISLSVPGRTIYNEDYSQTIYPEIVFITLYGKLAEKANQRIQKGTNCKLICRKQTDITDGDNGKKQYYHKFIAKQILYIHNNSHYIDELSTTDTEPVSNK